MTGDYEKAISDANKTIALNPNYADGYFNRAIANERLNRYANAIDDFQQSFDLAPTNKAQEALGSHVNSLSGEVLESIVNPLRDKTTEKVRIFAEKGKIQLGIANSNRGDEKDL